jgi:excinuclease ABC subunit C
MLLAEAQKIGITVLSLDQVPKPVYNKAMDELKKKLVDMPTKPGVYEFKDKAGKVIYVGKAKNLKNRVSQYFGHDTRAQIPFLIAEATDLDYTVVESELEALFLENTIIKQYMPKFNIKLRDDKNYAFIKIDYTTEIPQIGYARKIEEQPHPNPLLPRRGNLPSPNEGRVAEGRERFKRTKYFGPYSSTYKIRQTLDLTRKIFPYCANTEIGKRPCFYYHLHRCPGVCIGQISLDEYKQQLDRIQLFLSGQTSPIKKELKKTMDIASKQKLFEKAARLRDQLRALEVLDERQITMFPSNVDWDFISVFEQVGVACVNLFKVREGRPIDKENFIFEDGYNKFGVEAPASSPLLQRRGARGEVIDSPKTPSGLRPPSPLQEKEARASAIIETFLETYYTDATDVSREIYTMADISNASLVQTLLRSRVNRKTVIERPTRGKKLQLINLGKTNAEEYLRKWQRDQASDIDYMNQILEGLRDTLQLPTLPRRIECYDISNIQGTNPVGSMVVFKDGQSAKSEYRKFKINVKDTPDDFAMMREMLSRRLTRIAPDPDAWPTPDLIVIDGGKGQLGVAVEVLAEKNLHIPVVGLAKRIEEIFKPHDSTPIILDHANPILQLLQRLRDEAHRFAITFHRARRSKAATKSALDTIPGIGPKTKKLLKQKFGTVAKIKAASLDDLIAILGKQKAEQLKKYL